VTEASAYVPELPGVRYLEACRRVGVKVYKQCASHSTGDVYVHTLIHIHTYYIYHTYAYIHEHTRLWMYPIPSSYIHIYPLIGM